jgi:cell division protein FtsB
LAGSRAHVGGHGNIPLSTMDHIEVGFPYPSAWSVNVIIAFRPRFPALATFRPYVPTALFAAFIFYFGVHALTGDRGLLTGGRRDETLSARAEELKRLTAERTDLEAKVRLLSDRSLSRDLLEERARVLLGFADPRDYVIRTGAPPAS